MPLVSSVRSAFQKLLGRGPYDPQKLDGTKRVSMLSGDEVAKHFHAGWDVNVERDFRKPRP